MTVEADAYTTVSVPSIEVRAFKATRRDVAMGGAAQERTAPSSPAVVSITPAAPVASSIPEALQAPEPAPAGDTRTPLAIGYVGWMNGTSRENAPVFDTKFFTPEIRLDVNYLQILNHPSDHTIVGSTEEFRSGEFQIEQVSFGGDFPLGQCAGALPVDDGTVRHDHAAQRRQLRPWANGICRAPTGTSRRPTPAITSTSTTA